MKVCPSCGVSEDRKPFVGFFCIDCYLERNPPIKSVKKEVKRCPTCGRVFIDNRWQDFSLERLSRYLERSIKLSDEVERPIVTVAFGNETTKGIEFTVMVRGIIKGTPVTYRYIDTLLFKKEQCPYCAKRYGGYFEAVLQLRGPKWREAYNFSLTFLSTQKDPMAFISKEVVKKEGIDIYVGSKRVVEKLLRKAKLKGWIVKRSFEHVTEKDGKPVNRLIGLIRVD